MSVLNRSVLSSGDILRVVKDNISSGYIIQSKKFGTHHFRTIGNNEAFYGAIDEMNVKASLFEAVFNKLKKLNENH